MAHLPPGTSYQATIAPSLRDISRQALTAAFHHLRVTDLPFPAQPILLFHEEKIFEARVRLTSHNILEIANSRLFALRGSERPTSSGRNFLPPEGAIGISSGFQPWEALSKRICPEGVRDHGATEGGITRVIWILEPLQGSSQGRYGSQG